MFGIVGAQLVLTAVVSAFMLLNESIKAFVQTTPSLFYMATFAAFVSLFAVIINRHEHPTNINLLALFTVLESYTIGTAGMHAYWTFVIIIQRSI